MPAATAPSGRRGKRSRPAWVLANSHAYIGNRPNATTAKSCTSKELPIEASFWRARPPLPSELFVHYPDTDDSTVIHENPRILFIVDNLVLFRIFVGPPFGIGVSRLYDYFIYRADPKRPSLELITHPHTLAFRDYEVGLLPRGDHYTIAALVPVRHAVNEFKLHLYHSETRSWSCKMTPVEVPQREFQVEIPSNCDGLHSHRTTTVITLGGEGGTMGWVDLWRGILLCDVLRDEPTLRGVPLPLPMKNISGNYHLGCARASRGIAFTKGCLKFVELDVSFIRLPYMDDETGAPSFQVDDWVINTWSNSKMGNSWEDWHEDKDKDCTVQASRIIINNQMNSEMLQSGLLHKPLDSEAAAERALQNIVVTEPIPSMEGDDVVYLMARVKFLHPKAWVLAVDLGNNKLQGVAEFGTKRERGQGVMYCNSSISRCMYPVTTPGNYTIAANAYLSDVDLLQGNGQ